MMTDIELASKLKQLILEESEKIEDFSVEEISNDEYLFGPESRLNLDSLDALQISVALHEQFGVRIQGDREVRKHMLKIADLIKFIRAQND